MSCSEGLAENHRYQDMRWMDWSDYESMCRDSDRLIELQEEHSDEDALHEEAGDNMAYYMDLDPEVAPVVAALAASGAVPFTSCSGESGHYVELEELGLGALLVFHLTDSAPMRAFADFLWKQHVD